MAGCWQAWRRALQLWAVWRPGSRPLRKHLKAEDTSHRALKLLAIHHVS